ncbi:MAG TPA: hypothetical protein VJ596_05875, partial [Gemmatimonadaceae bacterium]|nr:hypothetical protein [Gemmatimonadaceae bacterium]
MSAPPFAPQSRQVVPAAFSEPGVIDIAAIEATPALADATEELTQVVPEAAHQPPVTSHADPAELTDWLEDDDFS